MAEPKKIQKKLALKRYFPEDLQSYISSHFVIQHDPERFVLTFYEVFPPIILADTEDEAMQAMEEIDGIEAKCVARIVMTPSKMHEFYQAVRTNIEKHEFLTNLEDFDLSSED
jgi:hypothetical protein